VPDGSQPRRRRDREWRGEVVNRLERVGRFHPSRTILCTVEDDRREIDGYATVSGDDSHAGGIGVLRESVEIALGASHLSRLDTIIDPIVSLSCRRSCGRRTAATRPCRRSCRSST